MTVTTKQRRHGQQRYQQSFTAGGPPLESVKAACCSVMAPSEYSWQFSTESLSNWQNRMPLDLTATPARLQVAVVIVFQVIATVFATCFSVISLDA